MYKLITIDLDGTLLNKRGNLSEENKKTIREINEKGINVVLATGRTNKEYLKELSRELNCSKYYIAGNGAVIYDLIKNEAIYKKFLNKEKILEIIKLCEENSIFYNVYTEDSIISKSLNYNVLYYNKENLKKEETKQTKIKIVDSVYEYVEQSDEGFLKIIICDDMKSVFNSIIKRIKEIDEVEVLDVGHMSRKIIKQGTQEVVLDYYYTEISSLGINKWNAAEQILKQEQILPEQMIAIGDNINDMEMISNAGVGIAMGQSDEVVKKCADIVTDDNENDGVAKVLRKLVFDE